MYKHNPRTSFYGRILCVFIPLLANYGLILGYIDYDNFTGFVHNYHLDSYISDCVHINNINKDQKNNRWGQLPPHILSFSIFHNLDTISFVNRNTQLLYRCIASRINKPDIKCDKSSLV